MFLLFLFSFYSVLFCELARVCVSVCVCVCVLVCRCLFSPQNDNANDDEDDNHNRRQSSRMAYMGERGTAISSALGLRGCEVGGGWEKTARG